MVRDAALRVALTMRIASIDLILRSPRSGRLEGEVVHAGVSA
jgi:hypothetical protein